MNEIIAAVHEDINKVITAVGQESIERLLAQGRNSIVSSIQVLWVNFATNDPNRAQSICFSMRKQGGSQTVAAYFLAKMLFNLNPKRNQNVFAWCALEAIKVLQDEIYKHRLSCKETIIGIVQELTSLEIENKTKYDQLLISQIRHYRTTWLASEEHLSVAFQEQRTKYLSNPEDLDNLRALGWTLHDCIKQAVETLKNRKLVDFFAKELARLKYPSSLKTLDSKLVNCYESDLAKARFFLEGTGEIIALVKGNNLSAALAEAKRLVSTQPENATAHKTLATIHEKLENFKEALREYHCALKLEPNNIKIQVNLAWALIRYLKQFSLPIADEEARKVLLCALGWMSRFYLVEKPSTVYSQLLRVFTRIVKAEGKEVQPDLAEKYLAFVQSWNLDNLTEDDCKPFVPNDKSQQTKAPYPSLAENVVTALYHCALAQSNDQSLISRHPWALNIIERAITQFPKQQWYPYYFGKLLLAFGRSDEARKYFIKVAQQKMNEFWVWQMLAETYSNDQDCQLCCLCRAVQCHIQDATYLVGVHEMLGNAFRVRGWNSEALLEYTTVDTLRESKQWKPVKRDFDFTAWSRALTPATDCRSLYMQWGEKADALLLENLPSHDAIVLNRYYDRERKEEIAHLWWKGSTEVAHITCKTKVSRFPILKQLQAGAPIRLWSRENDGREVLIKVEDRKEGKAWDIYPKRLGVLVGQDTRRGNAVFIIDEEGSRCFADWEMFPFVRACAPGTFCLLALKERKNGKCFLLDCQATTVDVLPSYMKCFSGMLSIPEGRRYGFSDGVYIPEGLLDGTTAGKTVSGLAVKSFNRTKGQLGWKAVTLKAHT